VNSQTDGQTNGGLIYTPPINTSRLLNSKVSTYSVEVWYHCPVLHFLVTFWKFTLYSEAVS